MRFPRATHLIITCKTKEQAEQFIPVVARWLQENAGVEWSLEKTKITHIDEGFNFLGFNVRKYGGKLLIKPSKDSKLSILQKVKATLDANKSVKVKDITRLLNPVLRGWANYYSTVVSKETFSYCDHRIYEMLWRWAKRRHPRKSSGWVKDKYFARRSNRNWVFTDGTWDIFHMSSVPIIRHIKIQGQRSPFRASDSEYFDRRHQALLLKRLDGFQKKIVNKTNGKCGLCGRPISEEHFRKWQLKGENNIGFYPMIPPQLNGRYTIRNVFVTHQWCHAQYIKKHGHDTLPDNPERFLSPGEFIAKGRVIRAGESKAADK